MKSKQFISLLIFCLALWGVFVAVKKDRNVHRGSLKPGDKLISQWGDLEKIELKKNNQTTVLHKEAGDWVLENRFDFLADQKYVSDTLVELRNMKVAQTVDARVGDEKFYGLDPVIKESAPVQLTLNFKDGVKKNLWLGKIHYKEGRKAAGRFYKDGETGDIFVAAESLVNVVAVPRVWLRKFLPNYTSILSVSYYANSRLLWQSARSSIKQPFKFQYPKALKEWTEAQVHQYMSGVFDVRYLDVRAARGDYKPSFQGEKLEIVDLVGRTFTIELLAQQKDGSIRCRLSMRTDADITTAQGDYQDIQETLSEWHFIMSSHLVPIFRFSKK